MLSRSALASTRSAASLVSRRAYAVPNNITNGGSLGPNGPEKPRQTDINTIEEKTNPLYPLLAAAGIGGIVYFAYGSVTGNKERAKAMGKAVKNDGHSSGASAVPASTPVVKEKY